MSGTTYQPITGVPGSGGQFSGGGTVSASGQVMLPDWVNQAALQNFNNAMTLANQPYTAYPGQIVAPFSNLQNQALSAIGGQIGATQPYFQQALGNVQNLTPTAPIFNQAVGNIQNLPQTTQSLLNPYLGSVESDTVSNIQRSAAQQQQQLNAQAQQAGAYGGTRQGVETALLDSETQRNIGQAINQIQSQGWNTASQLALNQASSLGNLATAGQAAGINQANALANLATGGQTAALQGAGAALQAGGTQQQQQQAQLSAALAQWQQQQNWPYQQLAIAQGALAGSPYGTTSVSSQPYSSSALGNALSTGLAALPAIGGVANSISNLFGGGGSLVSQTASGAPLTLGNAQSGFPALTGGTTGDFGQFTGSVPSFGSSGFGDLSSLTDTASNLGSSLGSLGSFLGDASSGAAQSMFNSFF